MAKATARRCKRDMAWSEDAGRERTKAWMQASRRRIASGEREGMDAGIGAKATSWTAWGAMAKASAHRCKRDMAWSEDAGRERTKAWMQA